MVEIDHISKRFEHFTAVDDLSFTVAEGEVLGFLGPNGAGKSTTMKIITGFLAPSSGSVRIDGHDIATDPLAVKSLIGYLPEGAPSYPDMTTLEFLNFIADVRGFAGEEKAHRIQHVLQEVALEEVCHQTIDTLSKGFKRRVGLAQAIIHDPKVLILDEPTDGLDPNQKHHVRELIKNLSRDKIVIISTHILEEVSAVCTRAIIIAEGRMVADGTPRELETRSRYHHAVEIQLTDAFDLQQALKDMSEISTVEQHPDNALQYTLIPRDGEAIFRLVAEKAQSGHWPIAEFHPARGQLEDYFRTITQSADTSVTTARVTTTKARTATAAEREQA
ncbi:MAG: ATP-binding cassette domain-containing protein [Pseudomonadales bacterium]|nr:ATP-binding cassette domain-containing protein [Pseudomonadales bacterium]